MREKKNICHKSGKNFVILEELDAKEAPRYRFQESLPQNII